MKQVLLLAISLLIAPIAVSQDETPVSDEVMNDVYVKLYLVRKERARLAVEIAKQDVWFEGKNAGRYERLHSLQAVSKEEFEIAKRDFDVARLTQTSREAELNYAQAMLQIAIDRVSIGLIPPICLELR